ncbi:MAG TPA: tetratricopeptide repeat protein [Woeseiaceae bacterium]|nr:tetratricopeptide repeat protein [Woeseiaceae bacterium]
MSLLAEFSKRNVFRVGAAYLVAAWLLIQVAETLFPLFGFGDRPARIVVVVLAIGFVPALVLAWAFRLTPAGLRKESETDEPLSPQTGRRLDRAIMAALALALCVFAFDRFVLDAQREAARQTQFASEVEAARQRARSEALRESYGDKSIAVLAFVNMSGDAGNEFFSDGISEELLNLLAKIPELRVISRSSAFSYKGKDVKLAQIAAELNVAHVLEGSVRKVGDRVRITAQLIDARTDTHLWSETFDRRLGDIFAIQEEIAAAVAGRLQLSLLGELPRPRTTDPEAYAKYLQARFLGLQGSAEGYAQAVALLTQVLAVDPNYTYAWDALAGNYLNQAGKDLRPWDEGYRLAREAAEHALAIDPNFAPAYTRLGWVALLGDNDLALAARHYQRALELAPTNVRARGDAATLLKSLGRLDECVALDEYLVARDPVNAVGHFNLGGSYLYAGRYDDAIAALRTSLQLSPNRIGGYYQLGIAQLLAGDAAQALDSMQREPLEVLQLLGRTMAEHALGERDAADRLQARLIEKHERDAAYNIAYVMAYRGQPDAAFTFLSEAVAYGDPGLADIVAEPLFDKLRGDPRWLPFLQSIGKAPEQLAAIEFRVPKLSS